MSEYEFWIYKDQTGFAFTPSFFATCSVARGNERLTAGLETFLEECRFFTAPWDEDEESEDSGAEVDPEEVEQEVQGLQEEQENPDSGVPE